MPGVHSPAWSLVRHRSLEATCLDTSATRGTKMAILTWFKWLSASVVNIQVEKSSHAQNVRNPLKPEPAAERQAREILKAAFGVAAFWQSSRQEHRQADLARPPEGCVWHYLLLASIILRSEFGSRDLLFAFTKKRQLFPDFMGGWTWCWCTLGCFMWKSRAQSEWRTFFPVIKRDNIIGCGQTSQELATWTCFDKRESNFPEAGRLRGVITETISNPHFQSPSVQELVSVIHQKAYFCVSGEFVSAVSLINNNKQQGEDCIFPRR